MEFDLKLLLALLAGVGIAAAAGLRAFLPLFLLGLGARFGVVGLKENVSWLGMDLVLVALGVATIVEIAADKIPAVDHALDVVATFIRPVAAWVGAYAMLIHWPSPWAQIVATLLAGGSLALHAAKGTFRLGSTATTGGLGNPLVSITEDVLAFSLVALAVLVPAAALLVLALVIARLRKRSQRRVTTARP